MKIWFTKKCYNLVNFLYLFFKEKRDNLHKKLNPVDDGMFGSLFENIDKIKNED
jgi:hypothetical protein